MHNHSHRRLCLSFRRTAIEIATIKSALRCACWYRFNMSLLYQQPFPHRCLFVFRSCPYYWFAVVLLKLLRIMPLSPIAISSLWGTLVDGRDGWFLGRNEAKQAVLADDSRQPDHDSHGDDRTSERTRSLSAQQWHSAAAWSNEGTAIHRTRIDEKDWGGRRRTGWLYGLAASGDSVG